MPPRTKQPSEAAPEPRRAPRPRAPQPARKAARNPRTIVDVTAVLVAHDGEAWLPEALTALAGSSHVPARVLCVDTGSTDGSVALMHAAYGDVLELPRDTGFGAAVAAALESAPPTCWLWLLHDDMAVEPGTLQTLVEAAQDSPSLALVGPKVRDWVDPRVLVEVGITTDAAGHRETGLERREYDQGQHDGIGDVLAVGTAGALIRREVWDAVGGLDPALPVFRDDLDLGWKVNAAGHRVAVVTEARIRHARAATTGQRDTDAAPGRATATDRRNALYVLLAHVSALRLLGLLPRLVLATSFRSLGLLLTRQVAAAGDEWRALLGAIGSPGRLVAVRASRAATRTIPPGQLRHLMASRTVRMRARLGAAGDWLSGGAAPGANPLGALGDPGPDGPDEIDDLDIRSSGTLRRLLLRPGMLLFLGLTVLALLAERHVLPFSSGELYGGSLLRAPEGASDLWATYTSAWHDVGLGTGTSTPPGTAALATLSTVLLGKPSAAIDVLLLGSIPLSGVAAYLAASRLVRHLYLRLWAAVSWALLPVATGTVAAGRLDAAATQIALPLIVLAAGRLLTDDPRVEGWWRAWALGLALGLTCAFAPLLWPLSASVLLAGAAINLALHGGRRRALAALLVAVVPGAMLFPWSLQALQHPSLFVAGPQVARGDLPAWHLVLLSPGGAGLPWVFATTGLVLVALAGAVRQAFRQLALACWAVVAVALFCALLLSRVTVRDVPVSPAVALQIAGLAMLTAALVAANGARTRLMQSSFGWRQLMAALLGFAAAAMPVVAAVGWVDRGADAPLRRDSRELLPPFALSELRNSPGLRVLVLSPGAPGQVTYALTDANGFETSDAGLTSSTRQRAALDDVVADLVAPLGSDAAEALSTRAVRYVAVRAGRGTEALTAALDAQTGLVRNTSGSVVLWQVQAPTARLTVLPEALGTRALAGDRAPSADALRQSPPTALPAGAVGARATVASGGPGRVLVLADAVDSHWRATVDGRRLTSRTAWGWAQGFELPAAGGRLEVSYDSRPRHAALWVEAGIVLVVLVLSAPGGRRRRGLEELDDEDDLLSREPFVPAGSMTS